MEDKQYPKLENNNSNSTIIGSSGLDSAQISKEPALESYTVKIGAVLEAEDLAFCNMSERTLILPILSDIYGISFVVDCVGRSDSPSFTSKKAIITTEHARYFLKQKA